MNQTRTATEDKVLDVLADVSETQEVRALPDLRLYDQHILDSLKTVELIVALEQAFGIEISPAEFDREQWATPGQIVAYVEERLVRG